MGEIGKNEAAAGRIPAPSAAEIVGLDRWASWVFSGWSSGAVCSPSSASGPVRTARAGMSIWNSLFLLFFFFFYWMCFGKVCEDRKDFDLIDA